MDKVLSRIPFIILWVILGGILQHYVNFLQRMNLSCGVNLEREQANRKLAWLGPKVHKMSLNAPLMN